MTEKAEKPIVIEDREELIFMLSEAAQLEHMLMCEYLFAAFSLKNDLSEGLTPTQLEAVKRWNRGISAVAAQEMLHLALVANLHTAVGAYPHFNRPNFPQRARWYPPQVQIDLLPFGQEALEHFLFLERPEGLQRADAPLFAVSGADDGEVTGDEIVPVQQDFATVGHLYRQIEAGFRHLVAKYGEERVFIGPPAAQALSKYFSWPELIPVTNLAAAIKAIETIVIEGEGARGDGADAHYGKFLTIYNEYIELKRQDPDFEAARPVTLAWVRPPTGIDVTKFITEPLTAAISDLFNASYQMLLQILIRFFVNEGESEGELQTLSDAAVDMMFNVIKPLGELLTTQPIGADFPGKTAGPNFEIFRTGYLLPHHAAAWLLLHERMSELGDYCQELTARPGAPSALSVVAAGLVKLEAAIGQHIITK